MAVQIQLRRGTASQWTSSNPLLAQGELGLETDTLKLKIGDGTNTWTGLSYYAGGAITSETDPIYTASSWYTTTNNSANWDIAYTDRNKWDGGATGLVAATGRTSLGLGTAATTAATDYATAAQGTKADTAYSWGNHASAGYLTTSSAASTYAPLTGTGTSGTWGISITGNAATATNVAYSGLTGTVPTWNQNTTGTAANITATSNSTLTTLSALSLPYSQLSGTVPTWNQNTTGTASNVTGTVAIANGGTGATTLAGASIVTYTGTEALSNKTVVQRVVSIADATSITINADTTDIATQANTQTAGTLTVNAPTGTPVNGQKIVLRLQSTNVQTFSWNAIFAGSTDLALPSASTGSSKYDYVGFIYNSTAAKWQLLAKVFGF